MILLLDNYDSFTFNLEQYIGKINANIRVVKNDQLTVSEIRKLDISHLVISPGPGNQYNTGITIDLLNEIKGKIPILGICLGHQTIGHYFGAKIIKSNKIMHGKTSQITHNKKSILFNDIPSKFIATRYHSLVIDRLYENNNINITSYSDDGEIMSIEHKYLPLYGVQYHPEAILTEYGEKLIENFLNIIV
tara:strand:+ start:1137 stop:1709 length:573 start_codon:yes stop_codon:yes gene_type:complete